jgi:hypothetical protein
MDIFSQEALVLVILFVVLSSPEAYKITEPILGHHRMLAVAVHGFVMVALAQLIVPYLKAHPSLTTTPLGDSRLA